MKPWPEDLALVVRLVLITPSAPIDFDRFVVFRDGVRADIEAKMREHPDQSFQNRIVDAGFEQEMHKTHAEWKDLIVSRDEDVRYIVVSDAGEIVGLLAVRRDCEEVATYCRVLYRDRPHRGHVDPIAMFERLKTWLRDDGIKTIRGGNTGNAGAEHLRALGFVKRDGIWTLEV